MSSTTCHPHPDAVDVTSVDDPHGSRTMLCPDCNETYQVPER